jgi:hypothetical protein
LSAAIKNYDEYVSFCLISQIYNYTMPHTCPHCRATFPGEETCQERFNISQLKEVEQPAYYAVHHLSVPCYMLQHNVYSRQGWLEVQKLLSKFVYVGWTPAMARRQYRVNADSGQRTWSFTKGAKLSGVENVIWSFTSADIRLETAEAYCADVTQWAKGILADTEDLIRSVDVTASP